MAHDGGAQMQIGIAVVFWFEAELVLKGGRDCFYLC